jgi:CubicO group peptidase (beta-lactamase class C family)
MTRPARRSTRRRLLAGAAGFAAAAAVPPAVLFAVTPGAPSGPRAAASGFDPAGLRRVAERARGLDQLHGLVVSRDGEIAMAEAFRGPSLETPVNVKSVSKTLVAALVGAALDRGDLPGGVPDGAFRTLGEVAPGLIPEGADPRVAEIRLADLLSLQAGLARTSGANYGAFVASPDWVAHVLTRPFVAAPGAGFLYSTGSTHVLGAALAAATGRSLLEMARDWLGAPLDIEIPPWTRDPQGRYLGGNNMALSPLALWRFGEACRQGGTWQGRRVLPRAWLEASWRPRAVSPFSGHAYGWGWFLARLDDAPGGVARAGRDLEPELIYARGYGGQMLYLVPRLALTVAVTSDPTRPARSAGYAGALHRLLAEEIVSAAEAA